MAINSFRPIGELEINPATTDGNTSKGDGVGRSQLEGLSVGRVFFFVYFFWGRNFRGQAKLMGNPHD